MHVELPDTVTIEILDLARPALEVLRRLPDDSLLPPGLTIQSLDAVLTIVAGVLEAATEDSADLSPSQAADRLRIARPTVMRLIARGDLSSRKDGGHYVGSPRELRSFQLRLASVRREALNALTGMAEEFGF